MASTSRAGPSGRQPRNIDDMISRYGSISGSIVSTRSRPGCSLRHRRGDSLARNLRDYHASGVIDTSATTQKPPTEQAPAKFNNSFHRYRYLVALMGGASVGVMLMLRYNITIAILRMVNQTHLYLEEHPNKTVDDFLDEGYSLGGEFNWNNEIVAIILSWYMFAYTLPQAPMSKALSMLGCRTAVPISILVCAIATILTPIFSYWGWEYVLLLRLVNGIGASAVLPLYLSLVENWMRYDEISLGLSMAQSLASALIALNPLLGGYLCSFHWSYAFYYPGFAAIVFSLLWLVLISDEPEANFFISNKELEYICACDDLQVKASVEEEEEEEDHGGGNSSDKKTTTTTQQQTNHENYKPDSWLQIFRVPSFYAYFIIWCGYCSSYSGFMFIMPTYLRQFLKIRVAQNGFYCFIITIGTVVSAMWPHPVLRILQKRGMSITSARIVTYGISCAFVAVTWIYIGVYHEHQLVLLFLNRCFHSANDVLVTGSLMSNYAKAGLSGLAFSVVNTIGNLSIVGVSTFFGWLLDYTGSSRQGWCMIYVILGVFQLIMWAVFATCIDSEPIKFKNKSKPSSPMTTNNKSTTNVIDLERNGRNSPMPKEMDVTNQRGAKDSNNFEKLKSASTSVETIQ